MEDSKSKEPDIAMKIYSHFQSQPVGLESPFLKSYTTFFSPTYVTGLMRNPRASILQSVTDRSYASSGLGAMCSCN
jgi:hypothetical protein